MAWSPAILALSAVPHLTAARTDRPPILDGRLDDAVWQKAVASEAFTQKTPLDGKPPSDRTTVRILYDDDSVYVGIDCPQSVDVVARLTRRDRSVEADSVSIALDTRGEGTTAFEFTVNAAGVLSDTLRFNDTDTAPEWDENWEAVAARTITGWSAEIRIPLRVLRFPSKPVQSWGLQVRRYVSARQETDEWAHIPRDAGGEVSRYGRLDALDGLRPKSALELRPFLVTSVLNHGPASATLARGASTNVSAGLDIKWHVTQALTLDATVLPDFGQVEADQVILNLTNYEIYYPEKRPFFLEGAETFALPIQLVYTRRIGRAPIAPTLAGSDALVSDPVPSTIVGAAKLAGDVGGGFTIGALTVLTNRQTVDVQTASGLRVPRLADPLTEYEVLRLKREIGRNAEVGAIFTATDRVESGADYAPAIDAGGRASLLCPSGDVVPIGSRCFHDAYAAGVDWRWRSASGEYTASGQLIATLVRNGPPRTMLDGTVIASGDGGPAVSVHAAKEGGKHYTALVELESYGRRVDYNDLGFMPRQNLHKLHVAGEYRILEPRGAALETHTTIDYVERDNLSFQNQSRSLSLDNYTKFKNFWSMWSEIHVRPRHFDDREVGDGAALQRGALFGVEVWVGTDPRKRVSGELWTQMHLIEDGFGMQGDGRVSLRISPQWDLDLLPSFVFASGEPRYVATQGSAYLFGRQRAQSLSLTLRSTYTFAPRLTLQAYAQAIVESEHFSSFSYAPARGAGAQIHLTDLRPVPSACPPRGPCVAALANPDFESGTINANLVARWEYTLGAALFVVYTHAQNVTVVPSFGDAADLDFARIVPRAAEDELLVKLSYWWG